MSSDTSLTAAQSLRTVLGVPESCQCFIRGSVQGCQRLQPDLQFAQRSLQYEALYAAAREGGVHLREPADLAAASSDVAEQPNVIYHAER